MDFCATNPPLKAEPPLTVANLTVAVVGMKLPPGEKEELDMISRRSRVVYVHADRTEEFGDAMEQALAMATTAAAAETGKGGGTIAWIVALLMVASVVLYVRQRRRRCP